MAKSAAISAALVYSDRAFIPLQVLLCSLPSLGGLLLNYRGPYQKLALFLIEHLVCLCVLYWIGVRARKKLGHASPVNLVELCHLAGFGMGFMLLFAFPLVLLMSAGSLVPALIALLILLMVTLKYSKYFFYPLPFLFGARLNRSTFSKIAAHAGASRWSWCKTLAISYGPVVLAMAVVRAFAPADDRALLTIVSQALGGQFELHGLGWVLLCNLRLGQGLASEYPAGSAPLSHAPQTLEKNLSPLMGAIFLSVGILLSIGNFFQAFKIPPHESFVVLSAGRKENELNVRIQVTDPLNSLFNFSPLRLSLSDSPEMGAKLISPFPYHATLAGTEEDVRYNFPRSPTTQEVNLFFFTLNDPQKIPATLTLRYRGLPVGQAKLQ